jgi:hypothetical protein
MVIIKIPLQISDDAANESSVFDCLSYREMIEILKGFVRKPHDVMNNIVEEASHPGSFNSLCFSLEIEHLPYHACFPV